MDKLLKFELKLHASKRGSLVLIHRQKQVVVPTTQMHWVGLFADFKRAIDDLYTLFQYKSLLNIR